MYIYIIYVHLNKILRHKWKGEWTRAGLNLTIGPFQANVVVHVVKKGWEGPDHEHFIFAIILLLLRSRFSDIHVSLTQLTFGRAPPSRIAPVTLQRET